MGENEPQALVLQDHKTWYLSVHMHACMISFAWISKSSLLYACHGNNVGHSLANQIPWHTPCLAFHKPFEPNPQPFGHKPWPRIGIFLPLPLEERVEGSPKKKFHLLLNCECASKKQKKKRKSPIKDWRKGKRENPQSKIEGKQEKEKIPDQRSEESKREIDRKVVGLDNVQSCYKQERNE